MLADSLVVEGQLACQLSISTKRKIRKVLRLKTGDGRRLAEGQNTPSVGRNTRFAALSLAKWLALVYNLLKSEP
jgi:hypothetical protein